MKLYVGLGNPGSKYQGSRHNTGFAIIDTLMQQLGVLDDQKDMCQGLLVKTKINDETVYLFKPQTFMNLSGQAVRALMDYYKIDVKDLVVIHDDMDFEVGHFKIKTHGSPAGHNGIKNIIECLGTPEFKRVRVGIGRCQENDIDYVLGKFSKEESKLMKNVALQVCEALKDYTKMGFQDLMTKYNTEVKADAENS